MGKPSRRGTEKRKGQDGPVSSGKQRKITVAATQQAASPFTNADVLSVLVGFLQVKDLFNFAFCSKSTLSVLSHEHVIRSVMLGANTYLNQVHRLRESTSCSFATLANLVYQIQKERIFVPSAPRLLRLVVSERGCEACGTPTYKRDSTRGHENGVACCIRCMARLTEYKKSKLAKYRHERMPGRHDKTRVILLGSPYQAPLAGVPEPAGPILTVKDMTNWKDFDRMLQERDEAWNPRKHLGPGIVASFLRIGQQIDENDPNYWAFQYSRRTLQECSTAVDHRMDRPFFDQLDSFDEYLTQKLRGGGED